MPGVNAAYQVSFRALHRTCYVRREAAGMTESAMISASANASTRFAENAFLVFAIE